MPSAQAYHVWTASAVQGDYGLTAEGCDRLLALFDEGLESDRPVADLDVPLTDGAVIAAHSRRIDTCAADARTRVQ